MTDQPATQNHCPKWWTVEQKQLLEQLKADGVAWPEIALRCGHTIGSCRVKLHDIVARRAVRGEDKPANSRKERRAYTETDVADLIHLHEVEGLTFRQIDRRQQRSNGSSGGKYETLRRGPDPSHPAEAGARVHVSAQQLADLKARKEAEWRRDLVPTVRFGDPLPGYSALDQKRASGESPR